MDFKLKVLLAALACAASANFAMSELNGKLSPSEVQALAKLRILVDKHLYKSYMKDDQYLIRFLNARKWNVQQTSEMLIKAIKWRHENNIDNITQQKIDIENGMPTTHGSFDREQRPVGVLQVGKWKVRRVVISGKGFQFVSVIYKFMETLAQKALDLPKAEGRNITQAYVIIDLTGFNARDHLCLRCTPMALQLFPIYENYYPQVAYKLVAVNSPRIFQQIWDIVTPIMSEYSKKQFLLLGSNRQEWFDYISKDIAEDQIPAYLGGTYTEGKRVISTSTPIDIDNLEILAI